MSEKPSDALFTLDTEGSKSIQKTYNKNHKPLKADQILALRSAVPSIDSHKRSRVTDGITEPDAKRQKRNGVSHKEYERLRSIAYGGESVSKKVIKTDDNPSYDPWASSSREIKHDPRLSYLEKPKPIRAPRTLNESSISLVTGTKSVPAVIKPKPGISYNPLFQDWNQLLIEEGEKEVKAEKRRIHEAYLEKQKLEQIDAAQEKGNIETEDESAWEGFNSEHEGTEWLKKGRSERKTPAERNKIKRRKVAERQHKWDLEMKKRAQQSQEIKSIARKVEDEAKARAIVPVEAADDSSGETDDRILRRRKLGKHL